MSDMKHPKPKPAYLGTGLLNLGMYWYLVWRFDVWLLGVSAFACMFFLNVVQALWINFVRVEPDAQ